MGDLAATLRLRPSSIYGESQFPALCHIILLPRVRDHVVCQCFEYITQPLLFLDLIYYCILVVGNAHKIHAIGCICDSHYHVYKIGRCNLTTIGTSKYGEGNCFLHNLGVHAYSRRACICFITPNYKNMLYRASAHLHENGQLMFCEFDYLCRNHIRFDSCNLDVVMLLLKLFIQIEYWLVCLG